MGWRFLGIALRWLGIAAVARSFTAQATRPRLSLLEIESAVSMVEALMANYLTRVELHRPYLDDAYTRLHAAMEKEGFKSVILGKNAEWYHLPNGEYALVSDKEVSQIVTLAKGVANGIHARNEVLAVQYERAGVMWQGLRRVE
jgi:hypothetical protein